MSQLPNEPVTAKRMAAASKTIGNTHSKQLVQPEAEAGEGGGCEPVQFLKSFPSCMLVHGQAKRPGLLNDMNDTNDPKETC